jgi:hypothetical protein
MPAQLKEWSLASWQHPKQPMQAQDGVPPHAAGTSKQAHTPSPGAASHPASAANVCRQYCPAEHEIGHKPPSDDGTVASRPLPLPQAEANPPKRAVAKMRRVNARCTPATRVPHAKAPVGSPSACITAIVAGSPDADKLEIIARA